MRDLCLSRCKLGQHHTATQRLSQLSDLLQQCGAVLSWKSSLSSVLAMSSAEAELNALCACTADVACCRKPANGLCFLQLRPTTIHEDTLGAKQFAGSGKNRKRRIKERRHVASHLTVVLSNAAHSCPNVCQRERDPCILALSHSPSGPCGAQRSCCCRVES